AVVTGKNKIVPSISSAFKNAGKDRISTLQGNVIFRRVGEEEEWGSGFLRVTGSESLAPTSTSPSPSVHSHRRHTRSEPRAQMLANKQFIDARAQVFAKYASTQWT